MSALPPAPNRRQLLLGGAMIATSAAAVAMTPRARDQAIPPHSLEKAMPAQLGDWRFEPTSSFVLPPSDELETRVYDQLLTRAYARPGGAVVMLLIAYGGGQTGIFEVHRPEACYPSQGYAMSDRQEVALTTDAGLRVGGAFYTARSSERTEQLIYWTRIGSYFPETWAQEHVAVVRNNLAGRLPDGALVRMSVISPDAAESRALLIDFAKTLIRTAGPLGRRVMIGVA